MGMGGRETEEVTERRIRVRNGKRECVTGAKRKIDWVWWIVRRKETDRHRVISIVGRKKGEKERIKREFYDGETIGGTNRVIHDNCYMIVIINRTVYR